MVPEVGESSVSCRESMWPRSSRTPTAVRAHGTRLGRARGREQLGGRARAGHRAVGRPLRMPAVAGERLVRGRGRAVADQRSRNASPGSCWRWRCTRCASGARLRRRTRRARTCAASRRLRRGPPRASATRLRSGSRYSSPRVARTLPTPPSPACFSRQPADRPPLSRRDASADRADHLHRSPSRSARPRPHQGPRPRAEGSREHVSPRPAQRALIRFSAANNWAGRRHGHKAFREAGSRSTARTWGTGWPTTTRWPWRPAPPAQPRRRRRDPPRPWPCTQQLATISPRGRSGTRSLRLLARAARTRSARDRSGCSSAHSRAVEPADAGGVALSWRRCAPGAATKHSPGVAGSDPPGAARIEHDGDASMGLCADRWASPSPRPPSALSHPTDRWPRRRGDDRR